MISSRTSRPIVFVVLLLMSTLGLTSVGQRPAEAVVTSVKGYACGYYSNVGLFGGPQSRLGCPPQISRHSSAPATEATLSPAVELPPTGSATPITATDSNGAASKYGPAVIFGGLWPDDVASPQPSGPITVSTQGTTGPSGSVVSSADIGLHPTPIPVECYPAGTTGCGAPGGFGPPPVWGDSLHVECRATESSVTGSTRFTNTFVATATDSGGAPLPSATQAVPENPPANYTVSGVISNVGDVFTAVFNEQIVNADGSLTVNAVHMYLFGPIAVGDMVKGQARCGTSPTTVAPDDTIAPFCGIPVVARIGPHDPEPTVPRREFVGVFDTGGIQSITNIQASNATVQVGVRPNADENPENDYLNFTPGQTGPLAVIAIRVDESLPMSWSFDATDAAGNTTHCTGVTPPPSSSTTVSPTALETGQSFTASASGVPSANSGYRLRISTQETNCRNGVLMGGSVVSTGDSTIPPTQRVVPLTITAGTRWICWVSEEESSDHSAPTQVTVF
jgi:hypothetical protein